MKKRKENKALATLINKLLEAVTLILDVIDEMDIRYRAKEEK